MRHASKAAVLCLLVVALAAPALWATTAVERTETDLITESAVILTGRCTELRSEWMDRDLVTLATISVSETLKGDPGSEVTVVLPGGIDSNRRFPIAMSFPAAPEIFRQETVLLFLVPEDRLAGGYAVAGFSQGKFTLVADAKSGGVATQNLSGLRLQGRNGSITQGTGKTIVLRELRQKIRQVLDVERPR
jgi:hypothetical protein